MEGEFQGVRVNAVMPTAMSQLSARIPDPAVVEMFQRHFQPEKVAGLVAYLVHRDTTINGATIEVGGGRASSVFLAEGPGVIVDDPAAPESWSARSADLNLRKAEYLPASILEELDLRVRELLPGESVGAPSWEFADG